MTETQTNEPTGYIVVDGQTGLQATKTTYGTRRRATAAADRLDNAFGGYRYRVKAVYAQVTL